MKTLSGYILESQESLWHFTSGHCLSEICKDDTFICSSDDYHNPKGFDYYMSTTRQRNSLTGYPTGMLSKDIVRIELDERGLHSKFKIIPIDYTHGKWYSIKDNWEDKDDFNKYHKDIMLQTNVEMEDRVLLKQPELKQFHKYIKRIQLNNETIDPKDADTIIKYCDKWGIPCDVITDNKQFKYGKEQQ